MIEISNFDVLGWEHSIRGMRNPMNSWSNSDSGMDGEEFSIGDRDLERMKNLSKAGTDHRKYMRMIVVYVDIVAPLYWWKEFDTYKVGTVANSCSTMHKIHANKLTLDDFSHEHLSEWSIECLENTIYRMNVARERFIDGKDKDAWWQMIQLLPTSYNQRRTVMLNYEVLANIYKSRKNHKLDEWVNFCLFIEMLPHSELITGEDYGDSEQDKN